MAALIDSERCDLAVVGAGIVGTMSAWLASAEHPDWSIVLIDRGLPGRGATGYSLAVDIACGATPGTRQLVAGSAPVWSSLRAAMPASFRTLSAIGVVAAGTAPDWGVRAADAHDLEQLRARWPGLVVRPDDTVLTGLTATVATPVTVVDHLALDLRLRGVRCWESSEVTAIEGSADGVGLSKADGRRLVAARVLVAVGPWITSGLWTRIADQGQVRNKKVVAMHLDIRPKADDPLLFFFDDDAFLLPDPAGDRYLFSFASSEWDVVPDVRQLEITADDREIAFDILRRRVPGLERHWTGGRVFCDAYTTARVPVVLQAAVDSRIWVITGSSGSGFRLSPGMALTALEHLEAASLATAQAGTR